jgi:hypothetical protein
VDAVAAGSADFSGRRVPLVVSADDVFQGSVTVQRAEDLATDGVFDDGELQDFLADLAAIRRADLA